MFFGHKCHTSCHVSLVRLGLGVHQHLAMSGLPIPISQIDFVTKIHSFLGVKPNDQTNSLGPGGAMSQTLPVSSADQCLARRGSDRIDRSYGDSLKWLCILCDEISLEFDQRGRHEHAADP